MAGSARRTTRRTSTRTTRGSRGGGTPAISPGTLRAILAIVLVGGGTLVLVALLLPAGGILNGLLVGLLLPFAGQAAWLLGALLLVGGVMVLRSPRMEPAWLLAALGGLLLFLGGAGLAHLLSGRGGGPDALPAGGGAVGHALADVLGGLVSPIGAFVVLLGLVLAGFVLLFDLTTGQLVRPVVVVGALGAAGVAATRSAIADARAAGAADAAGAPAGSRSATSTRV
ncbi:MAG: DNA translocase FtsK 4TM domain-containing protein, partial [Chloroflexota bacterium]